MRTAPLPLRGFYAPSRVPTLPPSANLSPETCTFRFVRRDAERRRPPTTNRRPPIRTACGHPSPAAGPHRRTDPCVVRCVPRRAENAGCPTPPGWHHGTRTSRTARAACAADRHRDSCSNTGRPECNHDRTGGVGDLRREPGKSLQASSLSTAKAGKPIRFPWEIVPVSQTTDRVGEIGPTVLPFDRSRGFFGNPNDSTRTPTDQMAGQQAGKPAYQTARRPAC